MNEEDGMNGNNGNGRGKTLLPEFLPAPRSIEAQTPPDRVAERARVLLARFRGLGTAASAALLSLNCNAGYMVVDPLPPPPVACTSSPDPFALISAFGSWATGAATPPPAIVVLQTPRYGAGNLAGFSIATVRITGGTLISIQDLTTLNAGGGTRFDVTIAPATATGDILVDVDFACSSATTTKHYRVAYHVPTSSTDILVVTESTTVDAGTD
jgi:hypothetical protein